MAKESLTKSKALKARGNVRRKSYGKIRRKTHRKTLNKIPGNLRVTRSENVPVTQGMLNLVRTELKSDMSAMKSEMNAQFKQVDGRFKQVDSRFNSLDSKFSSIDARFSQVDARFKEVDARFDQVDGKIEQLHGTVHQIASEVARIGTLVEEQNSKNNIVLEGLSVLFHRQERQETRMDETEKLVRLIAASSKVSV